MSDHYGLVIPGSYYQILCVLQENTEDTTYFSKNLYIIHNDRIHGNRSPAGDDSVRFLYKKS